jgi:putative peptide zinc metalloprotease protein
VNPEAAVAPLRSDLQVISVGHQANGEAGYVVHDPVRHRFFWLHEAALRALSLWHLRAPSQIASSAGLSSEEFQDAAKFFSDARLLQTPLDGRQALVDEKLRAHRSVFSMLLHNYLFFRIPLFDPTRLLDALLPLGRLLASRAVLVLLMCLAIAGLYFAGRQWDQYALAFQAAFSLEGALAFGTTIIVLKCFHELGHGIAARMRGIRVPVMGVAFMLLAPMLYTEVSDAWRLKSQRDRFWIAAAGVTVELGIAIVALFLWAFLPDGPWRNIAFFVSSTAWIMSVAVNLSPFMRFDGYHMLGDLLGVQNIGPRSFALANRGLRQFLFGRDEPLPDRFQPWLHRLLIGFAWGTCVYRLFLFMGIAYLVYTMFPKVLGLPLAVIEVWFFILMPVWREVRSWFSDGVAALFGTVRAKINLLVLVFGLGLCLLPLDRHVCMPAVMFPRAETRLYSPEPAQIVALEPQAKAGAAVRAGTVLARLASPELEQAYHVASAKLELAELKLQRIAADATERRQAQILLRERQAVVDELSGLEAKRARLVVRAPFDGLVRDQMRGLRAGLWVSSQDMLFHISGEAGAAAIAMTPEAAVTRLGAAATAVFIADDGARPSVAIELVEIGAPGSQGREMDYLSSRHGGPVPVGEDPEGRNKPLRAMLPVTFAGPSFAPAQAMTGVVVAEATPKSLAQMAMERIVTVFLRESGM